MRDAVAVTGAPAQVRDYIQLLKPRVMSLVVFTAVAGLIAAPGTLHPVLAAVAILCVTVGAGAAGAINMWYDRDIDAIMSRTRGRPLPTGRVPAAEALSLGVVLALFSVGLMAVAVNYAAAALLAGTILFYVFVYTMWLKRRTPQNIVIGGAAGAFPPMIGWAAVTGDVSFASIALFAIIFFWTPPHFWALALFKTGDYDKAGVPMLPNVAGRAATKRQILLYTVLLFPIGLAPWLLGAAGSVYGLSAAVLGGLFLVSALAVLREPDDAGDKAAKRMFGYSIFYLFAIFGALIVDAASAAMA
ncbi:heme o synthase [Marivibrio halodurans]|uniref:Protoheme IX farnesyltransferase n=1 Tax=Marivibrio halodurans TaxID=2039722 RepID=A0A8J7S283_9PROT|nr:heme o synthase [Marivibrio halodurans]MBP5858505.1 heme o synthase [Marivibrio halodurans]